MFLFNRQYTSVLYKLKHLILSVLYIHLNVDSYLLDILWKIH